MTSALDGSLLPVAACTVMTLVNLVSLALAGGRLGRPMPQATQALGRPVTLIRPVCGLERYSEDTLASGFRLAYPPMS